MQSELLSINSAYNALKDGFVIQDISNTKFKLKNTTIVAKNINARYILTINEFLSLYKEKKFIIVEDDNGTIDAKKDEEYYSFKHK